MEHMEHIDGGGGGGGGDASAWRSRLMDDDQMEQLPNFPRDCWGMVCWALVEESGELKAIEGSPHHASEVHG